MKTPPEETLIAISPIMQTILRDAQLAAQSSANIFIHGASGTGKEEIAKFIHNHSHRKSNPFIKVNCAAIPETLIESEFFGHERGAFTGAIQTRLGRFELAHNGTLLLDEISETPLSVQPKLLRAIQEGEFERLGGMNTTQVDIRFISTSNREMEKAVQEQIFREDLFYRLNVIPIYLPPLRERTEDIIPLANYFLHLSSMKNQRPLMKYSSKAKNQLLEYHWPGNIRELSNVIERAVVMGQGDIIDQFNFHTTPDSFTSKPKSKRLRDVEHSHIIQTLRECANNKTKAAQILDITVRTLRNRLQSNNR